MIILNKIIFLFVFLFIIFLLQINYVNTLSLPAQFLFEKSCHNISQNECNCIKRIKEIKCCCFGDINEDVNESVSQLFLYSPTVQLITREYFKKFVKLEEIFINNAYSLEKIDGRTFENLLHLRKLSITNAAKLTNINATLIHKNLKLQSLEISETALTKIPTLRMSKLHYMVMDLIDFSYNHIKYIERNQFSKIYVKTLKLTGNEISYINDNAFTESKFVTILLDENRELTKISPLAFAEIETLNTLDLSESLIDEIPVVGLNKIKHLALKNVPNLKKLPPVLAFNHLNKAEFTYPYHCCFFKYANREYSKSQNTQYKSHYVNIQERMCKRTHQPQPPVKQLTVITRKKREQTTKNDPWAESLAVFFDLFDSSKSNYTTDDDEEVILAYPENEIGVIKSVDYDQQAYESCLSTAVESFYNNITCTPMPDALNPCEDIVGYPWLRYMIWIIWVMALFGNILVWIVIITMWRRRSRLHYFFMVNLSIADFLTGIYLMILAIQDAKTANEYYNHAVEWQTGWGCSIAGFISVFASELSISSMSMIAFEIFYNAKYAFYGKRITTKNAYSLMGIGYVYALTMAILPLLGVSSYQRTSICLPLSIKSTTDRLYLLFGLSISLLCFLGMVINYILINCMIRNPNMPPRKQDREIFRRSVVLILTNMFCWVPVLFFGITATIGVPLITLTNAKICLILFYPINSCANPYLYVFLTQMGSEARKKAVSNLKRPSAEKSSISRFYYSSSPAERESLRENEDEPRTPSFLQATISTSLDSTPRCSSASKVSTTSRESRVSFQEQVIQNALEIKRASIRPRVSAAPEMSVISEHSTNSNDDSVKSMKSKHHFIETIKAAFLKKKPEIINDIELELIEHENHRPSSATSIGQDSGLGISVHSKRFSSSSNDTTDERPKFYIQTSVIQKGHHHKRKSLQHPHTPTLILSQYKSFDASDSNNNDDENLQNG